MTRQTQSHDHKSSNWKRPTRRLLDLHPIPKKHSAPKSAKAVLEVRDILWGDTLVDVRQLAPNKVLTIGSSKAAMISYYGDHLPTDPFDLARRTKLGWRIRVANNMKGGIVSGGKHLAFEEYLDTNEVAGYGDIRQIPLTPEQSATIHFGGRQLHLRLVDPERIKSTPMTRRIDWPLAVLSIMLIVAYSVGVLWLHTRPAPEVADIMDLEVPDRFKAVFLATPEPPPTPKPLAESKPEKIATTEKAIGEEGKIGRADSDFDKTAGSPKTRLENERVAMGAGILGALDKGLEEMDRLFGGGGLGAGLEKNLGMLDGISGLDMRGAGGLGSRGAGFGGDGIALGIGGLGTKGKGGRDKRYGIDAGRKLAKRSAPTLEAPEPQSVIGCVDKSVIARVIQKHHSQFRYCYQRELQKNPRIYGKVTVKFTIGGEGLVSSALTPVSTLHNAAVEACVRRTMKRVVFPKPKCSGIVVVSYPFIFAATGA